VGDRGDGEEAERGDSGGSAIGGDVFNLSRGTLSVASAPAGE
jgi:hypothetical protein